MKIPRFAWLALGLLLFSGPRAGALEAGADDCPPLDTETVFGYFDRCKKELATPAKLGAVAAESTRAEMVSRPTTATPETGFADRVSDSLSDFLTPFQFALSGVDTSEDRQSLTLRFNTPQIFLGGAKLQATIAEPKIYEPLEEVIEQSARESEVKNLLKDAGDLSNITWSLGWSFSRTPGNWEGPGQLLGRNPAAYEGLIGELYAAHPEFTSAAAKVLLDFEDIDTLAKDVVARTDVSQDALLNDKTIGDLRAAVSGNKKDEDSLARLLDAIPGLVASELAAEANLPDEEELTTLIANQPQLLLTVSATDPREALGPRQTAVSLRYEMGRRNFNRVLEDYQRALRQQPAETPLSPDEKLRKKVAAFENVVNAPLAERELRVFYGLTYKKFEDYHFEHPYKVELPQDAGDPLLLDKTATVDRPGEEEWTASLGYSQITGPGWCPTERKGKDEEKLDCLFTFAVDALQVEGDGDVPAALKRRDRVIGRITYNVPVSEGVSVPFSLTWSNRSELVKDKGDLLGAHVAISYKLPLGISK